MSITSIGMVFMLSLDVMIAAKFGTSETADALIIALLLPLFLDTVARESTKFSLIPIFIRFQNEHKMVRYNKFLSGLINSSIVLAILFSSLMFFSSNYIVEFLGPGLSKEAVSNSGLMFRILLPLIIVLPIISILGVFLNSIKKFNIVALRNVIISSPVILGMIIGWDSENTFVYVAAGYSFGFVFYATVLCKIAHKNYFSYSLRVFTSRDEIAILKEALSWPTLGFLARQGGRMAEKSIASLVGVGGVASFYYGFRIFSAIQTIIGTSIATIALPDLSSKRAKKGFKSILSKNLGLILIITVPVTLSIIWFSQEIIQLIFSRGDFNADSNERTATVLFFLSFSIPFMCMIPTLNAALYATERYKAVFLNMLFLTFLNITLAYLLSEFFGLAGLATSVSVTAMVNAIILLTLNFKIYK